MGRRLVSLARGVVALGLGFLAGCSFLAILIGPDHWGILLPSGVVLLAAAYLTWPRSTWRDEPPSERQIAYAQDLGIRVPRGATKGQVSDLISAITGR